MVAGGLQWLTMVVVAFFFSSVVVSFEREKERLNMIESKRD